MDIDDTTTDIPMDGRENPDFIIEVLSDEVPIPDPSIEPNVDDVNTTEKQELQEVEEVLEEIEEIIETLEYSGESL